MMVLGPVITIKTCMMTLTGYMSALKSLTICHLRCLKVRDPRDTEGSFSIKNFRTSLNKASGLCSVISNLNFVMVVIRRNKTNNYNSKSC